MSDNLRIWDAVKSVPQNAQKKIGAGRLKGMTDIKPQWRFLRMTELFGPCGIGWKYSIDEKWTEHGSENTIAAFVNISLFFKSDGEWSDAIPGTGGSMFVAKEKNGPYTSDEAFKMATTDALSVAMKMIGVGADIYFGGQDSKYFEMEKPQPLITADQIANIEALADEVKADMVKFLQWLGIHTVPDLKASDYKKAISALEAKRNN